MSTTIDALVFLAKIEGDLLALQAQDRAGCRTVTDVYGCIDDAVYRLAEVFWLYVYSGTYATSSAATALQQNVTELACRISYIDWESARQEISGEAAQMIEEILTGSYQQTLVSEEGEELLAEIECPRCGCDSHSSFICTSCGEDLTGEKFHLYSAY